MLHFKWVFTLTDPAGGGTITADHRDVKKVMDKRTSYSAPTLCYEVYDPNRKMYRQLWPEDIVRVEQETV